MTILGIIAGLALLGWAILPLFQKDSTWISVQLESTSLEDRKQRVYGNIADLEFDYAMGRLSDADFQTIRNDFLSEAGRVIERLEKERSSKLVAQIDADAKSLGKSKSKTSKKSNKGTFCTQCGHKNESKAKFCAECGEALS